MRTTSSLVQHLASTYPDFVFAESAQAHWSPTEQIVYYNSAESHAQWIILHETAHALLGHRDYSRDIELLAIERDAWQYATEHLAPMLNISIDKDFIETHLDTYRDWIHAKSTCPNCQSTGIEQAKHSYLCIHCNHTWHVNAGVDVHTRRYSLA